MNVMSNDLKTLTSDTREFLDQEMKHFIGGEWVTGSNNGSFPVIDPSSAEVLAEIPKGNEKGNWNEPEVPYAAEYPLNHVRETESGHVEEWDDTVGAERYQRFAETGGKA